MKKNKVKPKINEPLIKSPNLFPVVGIGASAGGLDAFKKLLKAIPENSGVAYVLVQHLDPSHESMLPELLQKVTKVPVLEITDDIKVQPDHIYVIPSNKIMVATDGVLLLAPRPPKNKNELNLPIDLFFTSLAEVHQSHAIGVVLSGTGSDGTRGLKVIKDHGGITFAQDEESAAYEGMPHSAVQAEVVDFILPPEKIPQKILEVNKSMNAYGGDEQTMPQQEEEVFKQIISLLHIRKGTDFTYYKQTNIRRRILRRMALNKNENPAAYLKYLRENKPEQDVLYQDLLIPVTTFFRDQKSFDNLCEMVFPLIVKDKKSDESIRLWVAGCSTGQEAYSIAICFKEFLGDNQQRVQIFATDLSEPAIAKARIGIYTKNEVDDVTAQRLHEFFTKTNGSYQVNKNIRDMCVFAVHNFLKDPPFGKIDFIGCRNVLIYMEPYLQKKALTTFHYSLNPKGVLLLGKSETTSIVPDLFASAVKSDKLFSRKDVPGRFIHVVSQRGEQELSPAYASPKNDPDRSGRTDFQKSADDIMLSKYTPAGVVVNEVMDIMHFRGNTGSYLEQSPGKPSHNLLRMAKHGLAFELRNILHKVKKGKVPVIKENIPLQVNDSLRNISIEAIPLPNTIEPYYLILFHDNNSIGNKQSAISNKKIAAGKTKKDDKDLRIQQLEKELEQVHEDMRGITEEQEAANEELQSANEELLSGSEELQSLNEELETSKEELESTNEELTVVNHEIISLNEQVTEARDYAEAIVASIRAPLLVLDRNLRIKSANNAFYKTFQALESETEGKLIFDLGNGEWNIASLRTLLEHILPEKSKIVDYEVHHTFKSIGYRIMLLNAHEIRREVATEKLILLAIQDVTAERTAAEKIKESEHRYNMMLMQSPFAFAVLEGKDMVITLANDSIKEVWGKGKNVEGKPLLQVLPEIKDQPFPVLLDKVYTTGIPFYGYEILARLQRKGKLEDVYFNLVYQPYLEADKTISGVTVIAYEVTVEVIAKKRIEESEKQFRQLADFMPQKIWTADAEGNINYFNKCWFDYTGLTFEELKDWEWKRIIHHDDWEENKKRWQHSIDTGNDFEMEHRILNKDGEYKWHLSRGIAFKDENGKITMWIGTNTDMHFIKEEEERKDDFIKMVSHELKTPVTSIKGYVQLLLSMLEEEQATQYPLQIKSSLVRIDKLVLKLTRLIIEMLDLSRIETGRLELQKELFSLNDLVMETVKDILNTDSTQTINVYQDFSCTVYGDKDRIGQVIINFISNAIKYSPNNNKIEVGIHAVGKNQVAVSVKDYGIGIDKTDHKKIFERFYRVGGKSEQTYSGFGIGLFIANTIIERHNGFITVESEKGKGSVFTFILPIAAENKI
jgi:two-component system, chemotaxis family, CheB/CheR fusion protein